MWADFGGTDVLRANLLEKGSFQGSWVGVRDGLRVVEGFEARGALIGGGVGY